jgi:hypothetical protein
MAPKAVEKSLRDAAPKPVPKLYPAIEKAREIPGFSVPPRGVE